MTIRRFMQAASLAGVAILFSTVALAAPTCVNTMTLADLIANNTGCQIQDKIFSNFAYSGGGTVTAANVGINVIFGNPATNIDIHGFSFAPSSGAGGVWTTGFTLDYTISVLPPSTLFLVGAADQLFFGPIQTPNLTTATSTKITGGVTNATFNLSFNSNTGQANFAGVKTLDSHTVVTIPPAGGLNFLTSLEEDYTQGAIPEPATLGLIGSGLIGLGLLRRKRHPRP